MSDVVKLDPDIDKNLRKINCDRRKAHLAELNTVVKSESLDADYTGASNSCKKIKLTEINDEVNTLH